MIPISYSKWHFYYNSWLIGAVLTNLAIPNWGTTKCTRSDSCETLQIVTGWCGFRHSPFLFGMISRYVKWRKQPDLSWDRNQSQHVESSPDVWREFSMFVASQMLISRQGLDTCCWLKIIFQSFPTKTKMSDVCMTLNDSTPGLADWIVHMAILL